MFTNIQPDQVLFIDIETVPQYSDFSNAPKEYQVLWKKKSEHLSDKNEKELFNRAGIFAEFGKIICISSGFISTSKTGMKANLQSFFHKDEKTLLSQFNDHLNNFTKKKNRYICAHNGKEFDFPYIARRTLINGLELPPVLNVAGTKPWETSFLDTMELWKFGDRKNYTSLETLAYIFNIQSPKDDIDGSMVADIYYKEKDIQRIVKYCRKDVFTIIQLFLKYCGRESILNENVVIHKIL